MFLAYTIKGMGLPFAGHKDNHAGMMTVEQMEAFRAGMNVRPGHEWDRFEGLASPEDVERFRQQRAVCDAADAEWPPLGAPMRFPCPAPCRSRRSSGGG